MKKNKKYILFVLVFLLILILSFLLLGNKKAISPIVPMDDIESELIPIEESAVSPVIEKVENPIVLKDENSIKVSLLVSGGKDELYQIQTKENSTVFESMDKLGKEDVGFSFKYTENKAMGNFVTEINGKKGTPGKYWIYYINEKKPPVGVSNYILEDGDIIRWNQEGI